MLPKSQLPELPCKVPASDAGARLNTWITEGCKQDSALAFTRFFSETLLATATVDTKFPKALGLLLGVQGL